MSTLARKRRRDMGRQKWQFIAVLVTVVLGVALFAGSLNAYLNLDDSLQRSYDRLGMADLTVEGADDGFAAAAAAVDGVAVVETRRSVDVPMAIGEFSFLGRVIGYPADAELNRIDIDDGEGLDPNDPSAIVLDGNAASDFDVGVGDTVTILGEEAIVVGIATSPEYLWPARDRQSIFTPPKSFAVVFAAEDLVAAAEGPAVVDEVLIRYGDDVDVEAVDDELQDLALAAGAADVEPLEIQPSNATIHEEMGGLQSMAVALPMLFLAAAGMAIYVVVTRLVFTQRGVIGTLRASGFTRRTMSSHYRGFGLSVGLVGAAIGAVLGGVLARGLTAVYTAVFGIPDLVAEFHLPTVVMALLFGAVAGVVAAVPPARTVARMAPAEAMRGDTPPVGGTVSLFERIVPPLRRAPVRWRMSLRGIGRNKKRSTSMVLGVVLGMTLILASWGMLDTMVSAMDRQFHEVAVEDASVVFAGSVGDEQVAAVTEVAGVEHAEPVVGLRATIVAGSERYTTLLEGYERDTRVHGFDDGLPAEGLLLGHAVEDLLGIGEGDTVVVELPDLDAEITTTVAGFVDEPLGTVAYIDEADLRAALGDGFDEVLAAPSITTAKALFDDGTENATVTRALRDLDEAAAVVDSNEIRELVDSFQVFFYVVVGMMLVFGGIMAFALIYNIISVNVAERSGEFASMRANGLTHRRVASLIVGETLLLTAMGIVPGLLVGYAAAAAFMSSFSSDQFPIQLSMRTASFVGAVLVMFVVAGLSLLPAVRSVKRVDVGTIVRERAT